MNARQMYRMLRRHNISILFDHAGQVWYAGQCHDRTDSSFDVEVEAAGSVHVGDTPEMAVEDYCNARNLEWDV